MKFLKWRHYVFFVLAHLLNFYLSLEIPFLYLENLLLSGFTLIYIKTCMFYFRKLCNFAYVLKLSISEILGYKLGILQSRFLNHTQL